MARAKHRALCCQQRAGGEWFVFEARGGDAVGEPLAGPFAVRIQAEARRFELMKPPPPKAQREGRAPMMHAAPAMARSRVGK